MDIKEEWRQLAEQLGFEFHEGIEALVTSPNLAKIACQEFPDKITDFEQFASLLDHPFVRSLMGSVFTGMAVGKFQSFDFFLYKSSSSTDANKQTSYVNTILFFKNPYKLQMELEAAGFFSLLGKKIFKRSAIITSNPRLEQMMVAKGEKKEEITALLSNTELQSKLVELFSRSRGFKISDYGIRIKEPGKITTKGRAEELMTFMAETAKLFQPETG